MANSIGCGPIAAEELSGDIRNILLSLIAELETLTPQPGSEDAGGRRDPQVLLDVEVGDVRLLALRQARPSPVTLLSPREQEIARMVAQGYANKTIASVLEISSWTVSSHLRRIYIKLQVSSRAAMVSSLSDTGLSALRTGRDGEVSYPGTRREIRSGAGQ